MVTVPDADALAALQAASFQAASAPTREAWPAERRMSGEQLRLVLERRTYAVVASTRPTQRPHATPAAFVWFDGQLWSPAVAGAVRARNVQATPWLSLVISEGEGDQHAAIVLEGPARVVAAAEAPSALLEAATAKLPTVGQWASVWLVLRPARLLSYADTGWRAP
jgi:nitroimidazol reductase NimA-like FMN-containing flavoprotein (pyridoxamine 5'-phosphate oxidase superfamily)